MTLALDFLHQTLFIFLFRLPNLATDLPVRLDNTAACLIEAVAEAVEAVEVVRVAVVGELLSVEVAALVEGASRKEGTVVVVVVVEALAREVEELIIFHTVTHHAGVIGVEVEEDNLTSEVAVAVDVAVGTRGSTSKI